MCSPAIDVVTIPLGGGSYGHGGIIRRKRGVCEAGDGLLEGVWGLEERCAVLLGRGGGVLEQAGADEVAEQKRLVRRWDDGDAGRGGALGALGEQDLWAEGVGAREVGAGELLLGACVGDGAGRSLDLPCEEGDGGRMLAMEGGGGVVCGQGGAEQG